MKKASLILPLLLSSLLFTSCSQPAGDNNPPGEVDKIVDGLELGEYKSEYTVGDSFVKPTVYLVYKNSEQKDDVSNEVTCSGYDLSTAGNQTVKVTYQTYETSYPIVVKQKEAVVTTETYEINLATELGKQTNLNGYSTNKGEYFTFSFANGGGQNPISSKDSGGYIALYDKNTFTISSTKEMRSITFALFTKVNTFTVDNGNVSVSDSAVSWEGTSKSVTFTSSGQNRFNNLKITYVASEQTGPTFGETSTIKEVLDGAKLIDYLPNDVGWYSSSYTVTLNIKAIDAIDSTATSEGYDVNARGKVLAMDDTGYMILSSGTETNPKMSFFQKVKEYLKNENPTYTVTGNISFLNGVTEVKVSEATYNNSLTFTKTIDELKDKELSGSDEFKNDVTSNIVTNSKGYGVNKVVEIKGLTYFNLYNKDAGSYLFTDQEGKLIPVFSCLNKDKSSLEKGKCYDIVGLESMYNGRPSFRILSVHKSELEVHEYDFENSTVKLSSLNPIYEIGEDSSKYVTSEFDLYSVDAYVSTYWDGSKTRYTFNTSYSLVSGKYTTGTNENDSASRKSLDVFNVDEIDYNQSLINYVIDDCTSVEEVESLKVTLYFTLTRLETINHLNRWRVNVIEDLIFSLDYYNASEASMTFDTSKASCARVDGEYQTWTNSNNSLEVSNYSTSGATIERSVDYLKIMDGTKLVIKFDKDIIGFTLYKGSYSYVDSLGDLEIEAYKQFSAFFTAKLSTQTKEIVINPFGVGATGNTDYLKVTSITIKYLEN